MLVLYDRLFNFVQRIILIQTFQSMSKLYPSLNQVFVLVNMKNSMCNSNMKLSVFHQI